MMLTKIAKPIPAMHAFSADDNVADIRGKEFEKLLGRVFYLLVNQYFATLIKTAYV